MSELVRSMLDNIIDDNHTAAQDNFNAALAVKVDELLDARKVEIAQQLGQSNNGEQV